MMDSSPPLRLRRRHGPAEAVADVLRRRILSGAIPDGGDLPKLEDLMAEFGESKLIVRQGCHILESEGLLEVRRGNVGGGIVHVPTQANAAYTVAMVLEARDVATLEIAAAVERFEPMCAELCAERPDRAIEVLPVLEAAQARLAACIDADDGDGAAAAARGWHEALVSTCGNEPVRVLVGTLETVWSTHAKASAAELTARGVPMSRALSRKVHREHSRIQELIARGDARKAGAAARRHLVTARIHAGEDVPVRPVRAATIRDELSGWGGLR